MLKIKEAIIIIWSIDVLFKLIVVCVWVCVFMCLCIWEPLFGWVYIHYNQVVEARIWPRVPFSSFVLCDGKPRCCLMCLCQATDPWFSQEFTDMCRFTDMCIFTWLHVSLPREPAYQSLYLILTAIWDSLCIW